MGQNQETEWLMQWLKDDLHRPMFDVRSPGEFSQGHIPGAVNFPLFTDEERAIVGTLYKQKGKDQALEAGLRFVGPKLETFVKDAKRIARDRQVLVHCWRGGQRSGSMAWLLRTAGFEVTALPGGYKQYRKIIAEGFHSIRLKLIVVGGQTGSGKTKVLRELAKLGEQVVDLEAIAHHKGSAFGFIGETPQPTVEQFENDLFSAVVRLDPEQPVWIENESHGIGRVFIPQDFWLQMKSAPLVNIEIPESERILNLLDDYVLDHREELKAAFEKIRSKLGGLAHKNAMEALDSGDFETAARLALFYYDKTYRHGLETSAAPQIRRMAFDTRDPARIAAGLLSVKNSLIG